MYYDFDEEREILDIPNICPRCQNELELDVNYYTTYLLCSNSECDYELDVTDEFKNLQEDEDEDNQQ